MTWLREMGVLLKLWWRAELNYYHAMKALKKRIKELAKENTRG